MLLNGLDRICVHISTESIGAEKSKDTYSDVSNVERYGDPTYLPSMG